MLKISTTSILSKIKSLKEPGEYFKLEPQYKKVSCFASQAEITEFARNMNEQILKKRDLYKADRELNLSLQRMLDLLVTVTVLIPAVIIMGVAALTMKVAKPDDKVFFKQNRIGRNGIEFPMYKLKTVEKMPDGWRVMSKYTKLLRKYSIDELPQIYNVIKGDMSFMGPRPLLYVELMKDSRIAPKDYLVRRSIIKPGFGFGYDKGRKLTKPRIELEEELFKDRGLKSYIKILKNLAITIIRGNNA